MDIKALDKELQQIARKRNDLNKLGYDDPSYDDVEEQLHDLEDSFQEKYGKDLEKVLQDVHDKYCPDNDVLLPVAYLAKAYKISDKNEFSVEDNEGVFVEIDDLPGRDTKLVIVPNPTRILLNGGKEKQKVLWSAS
jgi:hypothetical protein